MTASTPPAPTTPRASWSDALAGRASWALDPTAYPHLLVLAAHPDDETLAAGGLMQAVHDAGGQVEIVVATDGEAAFPSLDRAARAVLGRERRLELYRALRAHGMGSVPVCWLGMPDSGLDTVHRRRELAEGLRERLGQATAYLAPWSGDPHPDHAVVGRCAAAEAPARVSGWQYPVWMWTRTRPDDPAIPWEQLGHHTLTRQQRERKRCAVSCFASQLRPAPTGGPPILPAEVLAWFDTPRERYFRVAPARGAPVERFEQLYAEPGGDPWRVRDSWYERRKRAVTLACLPRSRYGHAAEPGCGIGELTRELAARCDRLAASDYASRAVATTRAVTADLPGVVVSQLGLPSERALPDGIDLAVFSEVLYYLSARDLDETVDRAARALRPGGDVVLVHWRGLAPEAPMDAEQAHAAILDDPRFETVVEHRDPEFLLHVARRR